MNCPNCKAEITNDMKFCIKCGTKIETPETAAKPGEAVAQIPKVNLVKPAAQDKPAEETKAPAPEQNKPAEETKPQAPAQDKPAEETKPQAPEQNKPAEEAKAQAPEQSKPA
ncbi:MAG: zinc-ribbon domain-containing protein, partial [Ruminococcus sp.]|nr:zinc-ribbon domain-containing protein [Ruminococcus sp.]